MCRRDPVGWARIRETWLAPAPGAPDPHMVKTVIAIAILGLLWIAAASYSVIHAARRVGLALGCSRVLPDGRTMFFSTIG
jgi:hypothetical protein